MKPKQTLVATVAFVVLVLVIGLGVTSPTQDPRIGNENVPVSAEQPKNEPPKKMVVADVIKAFKLDESKMGYEDEPPGKLRVIKWEKAKVPGIEIDVSIAIKVVYTTNIFSIEREWDAKAVRAAAVIDIRIAPWTNNNVPHE